MKKINKVMTVKMTADVEILPLNATFVARMMRAQSSLVHANDTITIAVERAFRYADIEEDVLMLKSVQEGMTEALNFFADMYFIMTNEEEKVI